MIDPTCNPKSSILDEAASIVAGPRADRYGNPLTMANIIAQLWQPIVQQAADQHRETNLFDPAIHGLWLQPRFVNLMLLQLKVARELVRPHRDNRVGMAGYAQVQDMVMQELDVVDEPIQEEILWPFMGHATEKTPSEYGERSDFRYVVEPADRVEEVDLTLEGQVADLALQNFVPVTVTKLFPVGEWFFGLCEDEEGATKHHYMMISETGETIMCRAPLFREQPKPARLLSVSIPDPKGCAAADAKKEWHQLYQLNWSDGRLKPIVPESKSQNENGQNEKAENENVEIENSEFGNRQFDTLTIGNTEFPVGAWFLCEFETVKDGGGIYIFPVRIRTDRNSISVKDDSATRPILARLLRPWPHQQAVDIEQFKKSQTVIYALDAATGMLTPSDYATEARRSGENQKPKTELSEADAAKMGAAMMAELDDPSIILRDWLIRNKVTGINRSPMMKSAVQWHDGRFFNDVEWDGTLIGAGIFAPGPDIIGYGELRLLKDGRCVFIPNELEGMTVTAPGALVASIKVTRSTLPPVAKPTT